MIGDGFGGGEGWEGEGAAGVGGGLFVAGVHVGAQVWEVREELREHADGLGACSGAQGEVAGVEAWMRSWVRAAAGCGAPSSSGAARSVRPGMGGLR